MKTHQKYVIRVLTVCLVAAAIEIFVLNFNYFNLKLISNVPTDIIYELNDFTEINWEKSDNILISEDDPNLVLQNIDIKTVSVTIYADYEGTVPYTDVYYTNNEFPIVCENTRIRSTDEYVNGKITVDLNADVNGLRIDFGDDARLQLNKLSVVFNESSFNFSITRFLAINIIYWVGVLLFSTQRPPKYNV